MEIRVSQSALGLLSLVCSFNAWALSDPATDDPLSNFTFLAGVAQGIEKSGGRHVMTFYRGGQDGDRVPLPDISTWISRVLASP